MKRIPPSRINESHPDYELCRRVADRVVDRAGGHSSLCRRIPILIRQAIDEVIDTRHTGRLYLSQIEKTEKTYIGTKIEILVRDFLGLPKGRLDLRVDEQDVDIKNTIGNNWMIPTEAVSKPCLLVASDEESSLCYLGVIIARTEYLTAGANKDGKRSISAAGFENILWLLLKEPYPRSFWSTIDPAVAAQIMDIHASGTERLRRVFAAVREIPIHRSVVEDVAMQKDYMKRLRKNGGARGPLLKERIALLSGKYHADMIRALGLPSCTKEEFISLSIDSEERRRILSEGGYC